LSTGQNLSIIKTAEAVINPLCFKRRLIIVKAHRFSGVTAITAGKSNRFSGFQA